MYGPQLMDHKLWSITVLMEFYIQIFIHNKMDFIINRCLSMVLNELNFTYVDNLIVSFDSETTDSDIDLIWSQVTQEKVRYFGKNYFNEVWLHFM